MSSPEAVVVTRDLYYHERDYVRGLENALHEAERFMSYFAGETDNVFEGPGTPKSCLEMIRNALTGKTNS